MKSLFTKPRTAAQITQQLETLRDELAAALGDHLVAVIVYGDFIHPNKFDSAHGTVNLMLVLDGIDCSLLDRAGTPIAKAEKHIRLSVMTVTADDLKSSCDVFPVKFHNIQQNHRLLYGNDVLSELQISDEHLRLRCEQEVKNLMIRLRAAYLHRSQDADQLRQTLTDATHTLITNLAACVLLKTGIVPEVDDEVIVAFGQEFQIDVAPLREVRGLPQDRTPPLDDVKRLYDAFMAFVHKTATAVDSFEVAP